MTYEQLDQRQLFSGAVQVDDGLAVVSVAGEIDLHTAPELSALMNEAVAARARRVVVDLSGVVFMGASGLTVLLAAAKGLRDSSAQLTICGVPTGIYRLFRVTGLIAHLGVEPPAVSLELVRGLAAMASIPLTRTVLDQALRLVVTMAQSVVAGADGVSITLPRHGRLGTVAASDEVVLEMDHDQYDTGEGPCLDAAIQGERFHIPSLRDESRWPAFVPRAQARGIESILSTPLVADDLPIGALNVYSRTRGAFAKHDNHWADQFAAEAAQVVASAQEGVRVGVLQGQIQQFLHSREVIALAQGVIMHREGLSPAAAYAFLRSASVRTGRPLRDICDDLVNDGSVQESPHGQPAR